MKKYKAYVRPAGAVHVGHFGNVVDLVSVPNYNKEMDSNRYALKSGTRKTANPHQYHGRTIHKSTVYYENRKNRADIKGTQRAFGKTKSKERL